MKLAVAYRRRISVYRSSQRYSNSALVFTDGFESGDLSAWSGTTP
jgi:hypothetical protein